MSAVVYLAPLAKFSEDELRDDHGRWTEGGGSDTAAPTSPPSAGTHGGSVVLAPIAPRFVKQAETSLAEEGFTPEVMSANAMALMEQAKADPAIWEEGLHWYERENVTAAALAARRPTMSEDDAAGVLAAVSPRVGVERARVNATTVVEAANKDTSVKVTAEVIEARYQQLVANAKEKPVGKERREMLGAAKENRARWLREDIGSYDVLNGDAKMVGRWHPDRAAAMQDGWTKGLRIARGESPDAVLSGPKVRSFWDNMRNPRGSDSVTIDAWMVKALTGKHDASEAEVAHMIGKTPKGRHTSGRYEVFSTHVREAAVRYHVTPLQAQAIMWTAMGAGQ